MSYQVLARKWRPQNFKEMVGQEHVLRALINALDSDRLHHAYLFTGTRGVGKTTIARILAKCLNCETGVTSEPCGTCSSCQEIVAGNFVDLIEVDAASRTKVEDTRELLDNVQYAPTRGRYKVYLIDEVHMLTGHSFNALLKTLEEPPPHVKFLFATTDPQKLPVTILSRCLQFNLKRMPVDMISGHLNTILKEEKTPFDEPSLRLIARAADGSMRDALSLLDQSIAFGNNEVKEDEVREMLGTISHEPLLHLLKAVSAGNGESILQQVEDLSGVTPDFEAATDAMISLLHQLAVQQVVPKAQQDDDGIVKLAQELTKEDVQLYYQIALNGRRDLPLSPDPRSGFEMILLRMLSFRPLREGMQLEDSSTSPETSQDEVKKKSTDVEVIAGQNLEQNAGNNTENSTEAVKKKLETNPQFSPENSPKKEQETNPQLAPQKPAKPMAEPPPWNTAENNYFSNEASDNNNTSPQSKSPQQTSLQPKNPQQKIKEEPQQAPQINTVEKISWHNVVPQLKLEGRAAELIKHCLLESEDDGIINLLLDKSSEGLLADSVKQQIESALAGFYGDNVRLVLNIAEADIDGSQGSYTGRASSESAENETPARRVARLKAEEQQQAEQNIANDPFVIELQNRFGAQIVPGSVKPIN